MHIENLDDLTSPALQAIRQAYERGYKAGRDDTLARIIASVAAEAPAQMAQEGVAFDPEDDDGDEESRRRAPKGLAETVIERVLNENPGMSTNDIEIVVHDQDPRISRKTVYNTLRKYEKIGRKFRRHTDHLWYCIGNLPPSFPVSRPTQRETGGHQPPESLTLYSQGDPIQRDQGGGT